MELYFMVTFGIILLFSFCISGYLTNYKFNISNKVSKIITFLGLGTAISSVVLVLSVVAIWP